MKGKTQVCLQSRARPGGTARAWLSLESRGEGKVLGGQGGGEQVPGADRALLVLVHKGVSR